MDVVQTPWHPLPGLQAPRVLVGRGLEVVESDEEWGRQAVAGMNPCTLAALKQLPAQLGSAIAGEHVDGELVSAVVWKRPCESHVLRKPKASAAHPVA